MRLTHLTLRNWRNFKQADFDMQETVERDGETVLRRPTTEDTDDPERMTQTHPEQVNANREFREIVDYLGSIRYLHLVPQLIREPDRGGDRSDDPYGADFLLRMAKTPVRTRTRRLHRISQSLRAAVPRLDQLDLVQDEIGRWHLQARYEQWRPQPASVVRQLPAILHRIRSAGGPQVLLTTHATDILQDQGLGKDVVLLTPEAEGTEAEAAGAIPDIQALLDSGMSLAHILAPKTAPPEVQDLPNRLASA